MIKFIKSKLTLFRFLCKIQIDIRGHFVSFYCGPIPSFLFRWNLELDYIVTSGMANIFRPRLLNPSHVEWALWLVVHIMIAFTISFFKIVFFTQNTRYFRKSFEWKELWMYINTGEHVLIYLYKDIWTTK